MIADIPFLALIDTGAARSILHKDSFLRICESLSRTPLLKKCPPLLSVSGSVLNILGCASLKMSKKLSFEWVVMDGIAHQAILGADFLEKMQAVLDYPSKTIVLNQEKLTFSYHECASISVLDKDPLQSILTEYDDLFYVKGQLLKPCNLRPLIIDTGDSPPVFQCPYRTP